LNHAQICLAHQLRDCAYAIEAGDGVFAPRMKALLLRTAVLAQRHRNLAPSTRREYHRRLECALDAIMALAPTHRDGQRLRKRYGKLRSHLFTFLDHPELPADNNGCERELRPTATYRKVTGGFRSDWGADLFAGVRSIIGTAARRGVGAYQAIQQTLRGQAATYPGLAETPSEAPPEAPRSRLRPAVSPCHGRGVSTPCRRASARSRSPCRWA